MMEGGTRGGGLQDCDDAAIGMINVIECNDGANENKKRWQQLKHCRVVQMYTCAVVPSEGPTVVNKGRKKSYQSLSLLSLPSLLPLLPPLLGGGGWGGVCPR